jgi:DNA-binding response OmpR family regulator
VLLTGLQMPGVSGWALAETARARHPRMAVILMTGSAINLDSARVRAAGIVLMRKPFDLGVLSAIVHEALRAPGRPVPRFRAAP